jgi:hypothetical protein
VMMLINSEESSWSLLRYAVIGAVVAPIVIGSVLTVSYGFSWLVGRHRDKK